MWFASGFVNHFRQADRKRVCGGNHLPNGFGFTQSRVSGLIIRNEIGKKNFNLFGPNVFVKAILKQKGKRFHAIEPRKTNPGTKSLVFVVLNRTFFLMPNSKSRVTQS